MCLCDWCTGAQVRRTGAGPLSPLAVCCRRGELLGWGGGPPCTRHAAAACRRARGVPPGCRPLLSPADPSLAARPALPWPVVRCCRGGDGDRSQQRPGRPAARHAPGPAAVDGASHGGAQHAAGACRAAKPARGGAPRLRRHAPSPPPPDPPSPSPTRQQINPLLATPLPRNPSTACSPPASHARWPHAHPHTACPQVAPRTHTHTSQKPLLPHPPRTPHHTPPTPQVDLPVFYGNKMRRKMKAGAGCEDLKVRCPHYYSVATRLHSAMQVRCWRGVGALQVRCHVSSSSWQRQEGWEVWGGPQPGRAQRAARAG